MRDQHVNLAAADFHRRHQQQAEGVLQSAGQGQQGGQLQDVEAQLRRRLRAVV